MPGLIRTIIFAPLVVTAIWAVLTVILAAGG